MILLYLPKILNQPILYYEIISTNKYRAGKYTNFKKD